MSQGAAPNYGAQWGQQPAEEAPSQGGAFICPECGAELADMDHRRKHAVLHYGDDLIEPYPDHNVAAERKGALLDVDPATLRGFPRRRW